MNWLRRRGAVGAAEVGAAPASAAAAQVAPGLALFLDGLQADGSRNVLDLGPASEGNLRWFGAFARRIRVADLLSAWRAEGALADALEVLRSHPERPYDLVLAWNFLDHVAPEQRAEVVACLGALTEPGARLHFMIDMSEEPFVSPLRFTVMDEGHIRREQAGPPQPSQPRLVPAEVERLMAPFVVVHAFILRGGMHEYVAVRR